MTSVHLVQADHLASRLKLSDDLDEKPNQRTVKLVDVGVQAQVEVPVSTFTKSRLFVFIPCLLVPSSWCVCLGQLSQVDPCEGRTRDVLPTPCVQLQCPRTCILSPDRCIRVSVTVEHSP